MTFALLRSRTPSKSQLASCTVRKEFIQLGSIAETGTHSLGVSLMPIIAMMICGRALGRVMRSRSSVDPLVPPIMPLFNTRKRTADCRALRMVSSCAG